MQVFYVRAEPLAEPGVEATAFVVANDPDEALLLLRKDFNFSGYRLPPIEMTALDASRISVREAFGDTAPITATNMLHRLKPVTPVPPAPVKMMPPTNAPTMPSTTSSRQPEPWR